MPNIRGYPIVRLTDDAYVEWVNACDAPGSFVLTRAQLVAAGIAADRLERLDRVGHTFAGLDAGPEQIWMANRAGPRECCLTLGALLRRYASAEDCERFVLAPEDIQPITTSYAVPEDHPEYGKTYWVPWPPGQAPAVIDDTTDLHAMVPAD